MGSIADLVAALPTEDTWGPTTSSDNMLDGVPYAPFSKGDKLGRMADWTAESKDRERGRPAYNRNYRGEFFFSWVWEGTGGLDRTDGGWNRPTSVRCGHVESV